MSLPASQVALFRVEGMTCQNCARHAREAAEGVAGVAAASVDLPAGKLRLRWTTGAVRDPEAVVMAIRKAGFQAAAVSAKPGGREEKVSAGRGWRLNVWLGGTVTLFLMVAEWGLDWGHRPWFGWVALAVTLPVQVIGGARFYRGAWAQLRRGASNMDTLVSLGSTAAFAFSVWVVVTGQSMHAYFLEAASIITLISVGHWLEALASERAADAIHALMNLAPAAARRLGNQGVEEEVPVGDLLPGEKVVIRPGDRVPTDAEVLEGRSAVDESMLTGESLPVEKAVGGIVLAGTINTNGRLVARVTATGEGTALAHIIEAVERAQNSRAGIQRLADRVSSIFVPSVIGLALLTALAWGLAPDFARAVHGLFAPMLWTMSLPESPLAAAVIHATAVLIIACPCAMGLATPAAIMAGTNAAARRGILVRDGVALEKAGAIDSIVFDKTGTLTLGQLTVAEVRDLRPEVERKETIQVLAASVARGSTHPVARALAALSNAPTSVAAPPQPTTTKVPVSLVSLPPLGPSSATGATGVTAGTPGVLRRDLKFVPRSVPPPSTAPGAWAEWREYGGRGIEARRSGPERTVYRLGSLSWLREQGVGDSSSEGQGTRGAASTGVGLAAGTRLLGTFQLRDVLREDGHAVVSRLHRDGYDVYLLTGDGWLAAESVAKDAGIPLSQVLAEVKPEQKSEAIQRLQKEGRRVAFIGDGINDGPALARADLGVAVGRASDVARESADVVLIRPGLEPLLEALGLAQATLTTIRQNLFWAFFYNAAAVPLAMLGFFSPIVCAAAMGLSDLLLIGNSLRLRYRRTFRLRPRRPGSSAVMKPVQAAPLED